MKRLLSLLTLASLAGAQTPTATLSGTVTDASGGALQKAEVKLEQPATGFRRQAMTDVEGTFTFPALAPGAYRVEISKAQFAATKLDVELNLHDVRSVRVALAVAAARTESVSVTERAANVVQESAAVGTVVDRQFVENLPLNGRTFQNLIALTPGVVQTPATARNQGQFSVNGQRTGSNSLMIDGVSAAFGISSGPVLAASSDGVLPAFTATGGTSGMVPVDAMQEFTVQTSGFAPEFGRTAGGQISIVTRSGANQLHGSIFNYLRNDKMDASDWFANRDRLPRAPVRQNDFGGVIGGPIVRDRTFFFATYEGLRLRQPQFATDVYPAAETRLRAAPNVRPILNAYPLPNREPIGGGFGRFAASYSNPATLNTATGRVDHALGSRGTLFARFSEAPSSIQLRGPVANQYDLALNNITLNEANTRALTLGATLSLSPRISTEARFNWGYNDGLFDVRLDALGGAAPPPDSFWFPSFTNPTLASAGILPVGIKGLAVGTIAKNAQTQHNAAIHTGVHNGRHQYKLGIDWRRLAPEIRAPLYQQFGVFIGLEGPTGLLGGRAPAGVIIGAEGMRLAQAATSVYVQDTFRATSRLTLTYGVRWEYNPPPSGLDGRPLYSAVGIDNPATARLSEPGTPLWKTPKGAFAPRLGVSYLLRASAGRETTLRGGWGLFYDLPLGGQQIASSNPPYRRVKRPPFAPYPYAADIAAVPAVTTSGRFDNVNVFAPGFAMPYSSQLHLTVEQGLGTGRTASLGYVGALGRRLLRKELYGQAGYQFFNTVAVTRADSTSDYHAMQMQFAQRLRAGLQAQLAYAWAHSIDANSDNVALQLPATVSAVNINRGPSDFDIRHLFSGAVTYEWRGWGLDSVFRAHSAFPIDVFTRVATAVGSFDLRPNTVPGQPLYIESDGLAGGRRFNPAAFTGAQTQQTNGNLGRNVLRGFPLEQVDMALRRQFALGERLKLQARIEFFNVLNHPSFGAPDGNLANRLFGLSTQMYGRGLGQGGLNGGQNPLYSIGGPRSGQLALKLLW